MNECPVCKHTDIKATLGEGVSKDAIFHIAICDNCNNVYCYNIEQEEKKEEKKDG